jgi:NAD(P)-dependent dehydrogenase (short-subunit alcohol dehydrogenase family)
MESHKALELFDLAGKRALVTGSSQEIGFALAHGLAEHGAEIVLNGSDAGKLDAAAARLVGGSTNQVTDGRSRCSQFHFKRSPSVSVESTLAVFPILWADDRRKYRRFASCGEKR